jgi:hypothetical protein
MPVFLPMTFSHRIAPILPTDPPQRSRSAIELPPTAAIPERGISSPFEPFEAGAMTMFAIYIEPIRNAYYKTYHDVITFDAPPVGPIANMVMQINTPPLSEYHTVSTNTFSRSSGRCIYVLLRYPKGSANANAKHPNAYMTPKDLPTLYGYLAANGYAIDTRITNMMHKTGTAVYNDDPASGARRLVAMVQYIQPT